MFNKSFKQNAVITAQSGVVDASASTGAFILPTGTTAQRPMNPQVGSQRWNTTLGAMEVYVGNLNWQTIASTSYLVDYLVVAGGGGGGGSFGGGGGAGGLLSSSSTSVSPGSSYSITVGGGGTGGSGVVIIRYLGSAQRATGGTVSISGGYVIHTFNSSGIFTA